LSIEVMTWAWKHSRASGTDLLVLLALADWSNDGGFSWPSITVLAKKTRVSERTVQRSITALEGLLELKVFDSTGGRNTNEYQILQGCQSVTPGVTPVAARGDTHDTPGVTPVSPNTSIDTSIDTSESPLPPTEDQIDLNLNPIPFLEQTCRRHGIKHVKLDKFGKDLLNEADRSGPMRVVFRAGLLGILEEHHGELWEVVWPEVKAMASGARNFRSTATARGSPAVAGRRLERRFEQAVSRYPERPRRKSQDELTKELIDADDDPVWDG
jgi:hypothetical protein